MNLADRYKIDSHKLMYHPKRVSKWLDSKDSWETVKGIYPIYVEISPAGACNHRCTFCAVDYIGYSTRFIEEKVLRDRLVEMSRKGIKSVMFAGEGEPLLYKSLAGVINLAKLNGIDISITTNATPLTEDFCLQALESIAWIKCSINAGTGRTYAKIHRTDESHFELVLSNIKKAVQIREKIGSGCTIGAQIILLPENACEIITLSKRLRDIGADYLVIKPYSQHLMSITKEYKDLKYDTYYKLNEELNGLNTERFQTIFRIGTMRRLDGSRIYSQCQATPFFWAHIMATGDVYSCSAYLKDARFNLGNIHEQTFTEIWEGDKRKENYELVKGRLCIKDCRVNCRMDKVNTYLWELTHPTNHINFI